MTRPRKATATHTFTWDVYYPGDLIRSCSNRCVLERGKVYKVTEFLGPSIPLEEYGVVFVEGKRYGIAAEYIKLVEKE